MGEFTLSAFIDMGIIYFETNNTSGGEKKMLPALAACLCSHGVDKCNFMDKVLKIFTESVGTSSNYEEIKNCLLPKVRNLLGGLFQKAYAEQQKKLARDRRDCSDLRFCLPGALTGRPLSEAGVKPARRLEDLVVHCQRRVLDFFFRHYLQYGNLEEFASQDDFHRTTTSIVSEATEDFGLGGSCFQEGFVGSLFPTAPLDGPPRVSGLIYGIWAYYIEKIMRLGTRDEIRASAECPRSYAVNPQLDSHEAVKHSCVAWISMFAKFKAVEEVGGSLLEPLQLTIDEVTALQAKIMPSIVGFMEKSGAFLPHAQEAVAMKIAGDQVPSLRRNSFIQLPFLREDPYTECWITEEVIQLAKMDPSLVRTLTEKFS
jgi:hypothetical protein